jgi:GrpB-like predicted nucleotidyltransferase (UPF0157 family)
METLERKIARVLGDHVELVPYDPRWPRRFEEERDALMRSLPAGLVRRIEHLGSTAVPGLSAKPIVDMLIEVRDLGETQRSVPPILEPRGYDYFWRPSFGESTPPFYAWFIKRDESGARTHHLHMVEAHFEHWDRLLFRDYLIDHPDVAREYGTLKQRLCTEYPRDRVAYTEGKGEFVASVTERAKRHYAGSAAR